ncbi:hypothetical protein TNCV_631041 [Trichonephila clavipes]|nr:hypothetical protein TNCV_631041 [Trichonephila clavipes]
MVIALADTTGNWLLLHLIFPPSGMLAALVTIGVHFKSNTSRLHKAWGFAFTLHSWPMLGFGNSSQSSSEFLLRLMAEVQHLLLSFHRLSPVRLQ